MTTYTFKPTSTTQFVNWDDPTVWSGGVVPDGPQAHVLFDQVTASGGSTYVSFVAIAGGESFQARSVSLTYNYLEMNGTLAVLGDFTMSNAELDLQTSGKLSAASIENNGSQIQGASGEIDAETFVNSGTIVGGLTINTHSFSNSGELAAASENLTLTTDPGGFSNLSGSVLTGGTYLAGATGFTNDPTLFFNVGDVITTDAAKITLMGGSIESFDTSSDAYIPLTTSLHDIAAGGTLLIQSIFDASSNTPGYFFGALEVEGTLSLQPSADRQAVLTSSQLTIASGGLLEGLGIVDGPIENDGTVLSNGGNTTLILNGVVTGNGVLEIEAGSSSPKFGTYIRTLDLEAAASGKVRFQNDYGTLILGDPKEFTGTIAPVGVDDQIILKDIALDSITGYSYSGTKKRGVLTLRKAHGKTIKLAFVGDFTKASFTLAAGPQALSSDPPSLLITATPGAAQTAIYDAGAASWSITSGNNAAAALTGGGATAIGANVGNPATNWHIVTG